MNEQNQNNLNQGEILGNVNPQPTPSVTPVPPTPTEPTPSVAPVPPTLAEPTPSVAPVPQAPAEPTPSVAPVPPTPAEPTPSVAPVPPTPAEPTSSVAPMPEAPAEPVATPIPGTEDSSIPSSNGLGNGIGQEPGISLGSIGGQDVAPINVDDIGAVPPKQEKQKKPMNKTLFVIIIIVLIAAVAFGVYYYLNMSSNSVNVNVKDVTIGVGETLSDDINTYADITGGGTDSCSLNNTNIKPNEIGDYNFTITCGDDTYSGTVHVVDNEAPVAELNVVYTNVGASTPAVEDFITSCSDNASQCNYSFESEDTIQGYLETAGGPYNVNITISDDAGNNKNISSALYVAPYEIRTIMSCESPETAMESYQGTMTTNDDLLIGREEDVGLVYMGISRRTYNYTFSNQEDYLSVAGDKPELITFNDITGIASYNDEDNTLSISVDLPQDTVNSEAGTTLDTTYSAMRNYYTDDLNYVCTNNFNN